jgi:hypothetical protein
VIIAGALANDVMERNRLRSPSSGELLRRLLSIRIKIAAIHSRNESYGVHMT